MKLLRLSLFFILVLWTLVQLGCVWKTDKRPSVLVLAVDSLSVDQINCESSYGDRHTGFQVLCRDSVRFTHAYTPSVLQQPALGSLLTARYPAEINLWHNGDHYLSSSYRTVAEEALDEGVRTSFFSGGVPVWSKSGLNQGFETFNDQISIGLGLYYRDVISSFRLFSNWLDEIGSQRFFSTIYIPDLQFIAKETVSDIGEIREKSYNGQLEELNESLSWLWKYLKKKKRWNNTTIVLLGLNGRVKNGKWGELKSFNLFSENTHVALFVKPPSKKRDLGLEWKVDRSVSLVDVGAFLFDILNLDIPKRSETSLKVSSLKSDILDLKKRKGENKIILTESGWGQWKKIGKSRFALRQGAFLYFHELVPKLYNSFVDRFEVSSISQNERVYKNFYREVHPLLQQKGFLPWDSGDDKIVEKYFVASQVFGKSYFDEDDYRDIKALNMKYPGDRQISNWLAFFLLKKKKWEPLLKLGNENENVVWSFVAKSHLEGKTEFPVKGCIGILRGDNKNSLFRHCEDPVFIKFVRWMREPKKSLERERKKEDFFRVYFQKLIDIDIGRLNFQSGLTWDVDETKSYGASDLEMILSLPEFNSVARTIRRRVKKIRK